ncbi:hypothetical protein ACA910_006404 [Epithemia clementina (nom. ined.)]
MFLSMVQAWAANHTQSSSSSTRGGGGDLRKMYSAQSLTTALEQSCRDDRRVMMMTRGQSTSSLNPFRRTTKASPSASSPSRGGLVRRA